MIFFELGLWGDLGSRRDTVRGHSDSWPGVGVPGINGAGAGHVSMYQAPLTHVLELLQQLRSDQRASSIIGSERVFSGNHPMYFREIIRNFDS